MIWTDATRTLLWRAGANHATATAYDTAWVASLVAPGGRGPRFPASLTWLRAHQLPDGSWGGPAPYYHDRLLCTLRAVLTLHAWDTQDPAIPAGWAYLQEHAADL